jgi:hypothetical protein
MKEEEFSFDDFFKKKLNEIVSKNKSIFTELSEDEFQDYLDSINKVQILIDKRKSELNVEFISDFYFEKCLLELVILEQLHILTLLEKDFGIKYGEESKRKSYPSLFVVTNLMYQMNNNLVAFYKLLSDGFSFQANIIFRNIIEQGSTIFAVLLDDKFMEEFKNNGAIKDPKERLKHWYNNLTSKKIDRILQREYSKIESLKPFKDTFFEFKQELYQDSSEFTHSQYLPSVMSSHSSKKGEDIIDSNIFGRIDSNIERVCYRAIPYFTIFLDHFNKILINRYDYRFNGSNMFEKKKLVLVHKLVHELGIEYIKQSNANNGQN